ncbi:hypothetical protein [Arthrobacter sp. PsM3]|uniref:hypothetical protein n=1 Tax=Arthrobacter sp. PsM3 TaxID=3030531 RepID=UPI00263BCE8D|nr:hypothetical protein [Arthrobacter sp. PsM3]MDN4645723.1 hypothetical protein [Arthrobacter sp. PsM3]
MRIHPDPQDAFLQAGIPAGGLFSGAVEKKTKAQVQSYGGAAGRKLDSCYHQAYDTISNTDSNLPKEMSGALAYATASYALAVAAEQPTRPLSRAPGPRDEKARRIISARPWPHRGRAGRTES